MFAPIHICGVRVPVVAPDRRDAYDRPLLYQWRILHDGVVSTVYCGKAKDGQDRPMVTYPKVVNDLRESRGKRKINQNPIKPYFPRNPWGFRWIHHQLERACYLKSELGVSDIRIELELTHVDISIDVLNELEKQEIRRLKERFDKSVVANDSPSMCLQDRNLIDPIWL